MSIKIALDWDLLKVTSGCNGILVSDILRISDLDYVDSLAYIGESKDDLQRFIDKLYSFGKMIGLNITIKKTKVMVNFPFSVSFMGKPSNRWTSLSTYNPGHILELYNILVQI